MSAQAQKTQAMKRIQTLIDNQAEQLIGAWGSDFGQMKFDQGTIYGLRLALAAQDEAYKDVGGM